MKKVGLIFAAHIALAVCANAGWEWERLGRFTPEAMVYPAMAYDSVNDEVLLLSGFPRFLSSVYHGEGRLFARKAGEWHEVEGGAAPGRPVYVGAAFDEKRGVLVVYGGLNRHSNPERHSNTLEWDGRKWTQPKHSFDPGPLYRVPMVYDSVSESVLLYGQSTLFSYDGAQWRVISTGPTASQAWMAHDRDRQVTVLVVKSEDEFSTWEWNGTSLVRMKVETPTIIFGSPMAYDESEGCVRTFSMPEADNPPSRVHYEYRANSWTRVSEEIGGPFYSGMVFDRARGSMLTFGGSRSALATDIEQYWENGRWADVDSEPMARYGSAMAYDSIRRQVVLFGGLTYHATLHSDTWVFEREKWRKVPTFVSPPPAYGFSHAFDEKRGVMVVAGGFTLTTSYNSTWVWNGVSWRNAGPVPADVRFMYYDPVREVVVIDTEGAGEFSFDGESWLLTGRSSAHNTGFVVYDESRNVPVLIHYNGRISERAPTGWRVLYYPHWSLNLTVVAASYFDGRVVIYAGHDRRDESLPMISLLGSWDGTTFHNYRIDSPPFRMAPNVVLDKHRNRLIMYGGLGREGAVQQSYSDQTARTETWALKVVK